MRKFMRKMFPKGNMRMRLDCHSEKRAKENDFFPEDDAGAEYGGDMHGNGKGQVLFTVEAEKVGADGEVTATADWQIFREALNQT